MSSNRIVFDGLAELREALRALPADLTVEASREVEGAANGAAVAIKTAYGQHRRTGKMQDTVSVEHREAGQFAAAAIVKAASPHAHLFEFGTQTRHTAIGANRGSMPAGNVFIPAVIRARRAMYDKLKDLLVRNGLVVSGDE